MNFTGRVLHRYALFASILISAGACKDSGEIDASTDSTPDDGSSPLVTISPPSITATLRGPVTYQVDYEGVAVVSLDPDDVELDAEGDAACDVSVVNGAGVNSRIVVLSACRGLGEIKLGIASGTATDRQGRPLPAASSPGAFRLRDDVVTLSLSAPNPVRTRTGPVVFDVVYSRATKIELNEKHVVLSREGTADCKVSVAGTSNTKREIRLDACTGEGTVQIMVVAGTASDIHGSNAPSVGPSLPVSVDRTGPRLSIASVKPAASRLGPINFEIRADEPSRFRMDESSVSTFGTGTAKCKEKLISGESPYIRTVTLSNCDGTGDIGIRIAAGVATDDLDNPSLETIGATIARIDNEPPSLRFGMPTVTETRSGPVFIPVIVEEIGVTVELIPERLRLLTTGSATCSNLTVRDGASASPTIGLADCKGEGTIRVAVQEGAVIDAVGNRSLVSESQTSFELDQTAPSLSLGAPSIEVTQAGPVEFTVDYQGAKKVTLAASDIEPIENGAECDLQTEKITEARHKVTFRNCRGTGTLAFRVKAGTASDGAGNLSGPSGESLSFNVDNSAPIVAIGAPSLARVNRLSAASFVVNYSDQLPGPLTLALEASQIKLLKTGDAACSVHLNAYATWLQVVLTGCNGNGAIGVEIPAGAVRDAAGNLSRSATSPVHVIVDNAAPSIGIGMPNPTVIRSGPTNFAVNFEEGGSINLNASKVILKRTGQANCTVSVTGADRSRNVQLNNCYGDGTIAIAIAAGVVSDEAGNANAQTAFSAPAEIDWKAPTVAIQGPSELSTKNGPVSYVVTFEGATQMTLTRSQVEVSETGATCGDVRIDPISTSSRSITFSNCQGNGYINFTIAAGAARDAAGNQSIATTSQNSFKVDNLAPVLAISNLSVESTRTSASYRIFANEEVTPLTSDKFRLEATGGATCEISYVAAELKVNLVNCRGNGTIRPKLPANAVRDQAGNPNAESRASAAVTIDNQGPTLTFGNPSPATSLRGPVQFVLRSPESAYFVGTADSIGLRTTQNLKCSNKTVSGSGSTERIITISGCTGEGELTVAVPAGFVTDLLGNPSLEAVSSAAIIDSVGPGVTIDPPSVAVTNGKRNVEYLVRYERATQIRLSSLDVYTTRTGTASCKHYISETSQSSRSVVFHSCSGSGTFSFSLGARTAYDDNNNAAPAVGLQPSFIVDTVAPTITIGKVSTRLTENGPVMIPFVIEGASTVALSAEQVRITATNSARCERSVALDRLVGGTITLYDCSGDGFIDLTILSGAASDIAGNVSAEVKGNADQRITLDSTGPRIRIEGPSKPRTFGEPVHFLVSFEDESTIDESAFSAQLKYDVEDLGCEMTVSTVAPNTRFISVGKCNGVGIGTLDIPAGALTDALGRPSAAVRSSPVNIDLSKLACSDFAGTGYVSRMPGDNVGWNASRRLDDGTKIYLARNRADLVFARTDCGGNIQSVLGGESFRTIRLNAYEMPIWTSDYIFPVKGGGIDIVMPGPQIVRLAADGSVDTEISQGQTLRGPGYGMNSLLAVEQSSDRGFWLGGSSGSDNSAFATIFRITEAGALKNDWGVTGRFEIRESNGKFSRIYPLADGRLLVGGHLILRQADGSYRKRIVVLRLLASGKLDVTFGNEGRLVLASTVVAKEYQLRGLELDANGNLMILGGSDWSPASLILAKANFEGVLQNSFGTNGQLEIGQIPGDNLPLIYPHQSSFLALDSNGRAIVAFNQQSSEGGMYVTLPGLIRVTLGGKLDLDFGTKGLARFMPPPSPQAPHGNTQHLNGFSNRGADGFDFTLTTYVGELHENGTLRKKAPPPR